jgi:hypothetical protein
VLSKYRWRVDSTYEYQGAPSSPRRNRSEDRCKEHGDEEADAASHGGQPGLTTFCDASSRLNDWNELETSTGSRRQAIKSQLTRCDWRDTEQCTHRDAERIRTISKC